jgi:hypothetical protein
MSEDDFKETMRFMGPAIQAIRADAKEKSRSAGHVECPKCKGKLGYSIARSNGHVWGKCETTGCLSWMM